MRKQIIGYALTLAFVAAGCPSFIQPTHAAQGFQIGFSYFHDRLSPHGRWVRIPRYGWVWYPRRVRHSWQPYTDGYWTYTRYGWTWVSNFAWGDIPFHYGSWDWEPGYGWVWVPGYTWAPAWVTWRYSRSYIGWAPLPPGYRFRSGRSCPSANVYDRAWIFIPAHRIGGRDFHSTRIPPERNFEIIRSTRDITNISIADEHVINAGPDLDLVEETAKARIRRAEVEHLGITPRSLDRDSGAREIIVTAPFESPSLPAKSLRDRSREDPYTVESPIERNDPIRTLPTRPEPTPEIDDTKSSRSIRQQPEWRESDERRGSDRSKWPQREAIRSTPSSDRVDRVDPNPTFRRPPISTRDRDERPEKIPRQVIRNPRKSSDDHPSRSVPPERTKPETVRPQTDRLPHREIRSQKPSNARPQAPVKSRRP